VHPNAVSPSDDPDAPYAPGRVRLLERVGRDTPLPGRRADSASDLRQLASD
jgi:hypothetical protein